MNDDAKDVLKAGAEAAMAPFSRLIETLFGGAVEEIGGGWKDKLAVRRQIRQIKLMQKLQAAIDNSRFEPRAIPDNVWMPAIQAASVEDDDSMQERWANLLANAADPRDQTEVLPSFPTILKELTPRDAMFLSNFYDDFSSPTSERHSFTNRGGYSETELSAFYPQKGFEPVALDEETSPDRVPVGGYLRLTLNTLERNGLVQKVYMSAAGREEPGDSLVPVIHDYEITSLGEFFIRACRPPQAS
jgi:hypothetical protein